MRKMKPWMVLVPLFSGLMACNVTVGECWIEGADGPGAGAGTAGGSSGSSSGGDNGDAPSKKPQDNGSTPPPPPDCNSIGSYDSSLFRFKTTVADDGTDTGGGYQEATAPKVRFIDTRQEVPTWWTCSIWIGMPVRTTIQGKISASRAADMSADVLTLASGFTMHDRSSWVPAAFCIALDEKMEFVFGKMYPGTGVSVNAQ